MNLFPPLQSSQLLSELEEFAGQYSLGLSALKNLVKSILIVSSTLYKAIIHYIITKYTYAVYILIMHE